MTENDIIRELLNGDRDIIEDAESASQIGPFAVETRHTDETDASVLLHFDLTSAWRSDSESESMHEFDILSAEPEPPTDEEADTEGGGTNEQ